MTEQEERSENLVLHGVYKSNRELVNGLLFRDIQIIILLGVVMWMTFKYVI